MIDCVHAMNFNSSFVFEDLAIMVEVCCEEKSTPWVDAEAALPISSLSLSCYQYILAASATLALLLLPICYCLSATTKRPSFMNDMLVIVRTSLAPSLAECL